MRKLYVLLIYFVFFKGGILFTQNSLDLRIEPPNWWVEMASSDLQLMINGQNISAYNPVIKSESVHIHNSKKGESPNYLFIDLEVKRGTRPGFFTIEFQQNFKTVFTQQYELRSRSTNRKNPRGFDNSDVIYLLTPDRYANGNLSNDSIYRLKEGPNRSLEYGRHGGDIQGIKDHLDYIKNLGFTTIWLNPILLNDQEEWSYHGYATTDYYQVDPRFGSNEEYVELCNLADKKGLKIIMDVIANHCGSSHPWVSDPPFGDWFNYQNDPYQETNHRKNTLLDPYASIIDRDIMVKGWFVPSMPDLNQKNKYLSRYLIQNSIWWIEYAGIEGFRQDTYSYSFEDFMSDWSCQIQNEYPEFGIVGEEWSENPNMIAHWQEDKLNNSPNNSCLKSLMDFPLSMAIRKGLNEQESWSSGLIRIYEVLSMDFLYPNAGKLVIFPDNHDMSRIFTQLDEDHNLLESSIIFVATTRGIPQFYYGTEVLMSNTGSTSHGVIRSDFPGGWPTDTISAKKRINLTNEEKNQLEFITKLLNWRKSQDVIHQGNLTHFIPQNETYVYFRHEKTDKIMVVINKNHDDYSLSLERFKEIIGNTKNGRNVLTGVMVSLESSILLPCKKIFNY